MLLHLHVQFGIISSKRLLFFFCFRCEISFEKFESPQAVTTTNIVVGRRVWYTLRGGGEVMN